VEQAARARGCCKITLEVQMKNTAARGIYQSFGFKASFLDPEAGEQLSLTKSLEPECAQAAAPHRNQTDRPS
jgi:hypothetical protein